MTPMNRTLHFLTTGLWVCGLLAAAADRNPALADDTVASAAPAPTASAPTPLPTAATQQAGDQTADPGLDALVSAILERPLFKADRHPPAAPVADKPAEQQAEVKTPPVLKGRLAGVTLGPDDEKHAVFAAPGTKPQVVKEGDAIDGWTVSTIEASRVVLTSAFGERVVQPTPSVAGEGAAPELPVPRRPVAAAPPQAQNIPRPGLPAGANFGAPNFPNPQMARPNAPQGRPLAAARRNQ